MSVVVAVRDEDKIWLATDSQVTNGWSKSLLLSQHSFKICKCANGVSIGTVGALRDANIISTSDIEFISENRILKNSIDFKGIVRETVPLFFNELEKNRRVYIDHGVPYMQSAFILAYKNSCFLIESDGCVQELYDMFAVGSGADVAESAYIILRDTELSAKDKAVRAVMAACERDLFVNFPIVVTNTEMTSFEMFDGQNYYEIKNGVIEDAEEECGCTCEECTCDKEELKEDEEA
jgi:ATP-dependent protease HslVU (ClpYQ) peptidase subunit